jgi:urease accessory protein UreE
LHFDEATILKSLSSILSQPILSQSNLSLFYLRNMSDLIYLGHVLGNHHWPILVNGDRIYVEMVADRAVMEATVRNVNIPNLCIDYEVRSSANQIQFSSHSHH